MTEKRLQFRAQGRVEIQAELGEPAYGLFAQVPPIAFKRILSNLINNAVEGIPEEGLVRVRLTPCEGWICVVVEDTGRGIPAEVLPKLMERGASFGKEGGSGLGLWHAREQVVAWGGNLHLTSTEGRGTTVTLRLPLVAPPAWFVPTLPVWEGLTIVVLDDDRSIHDLWEGRFEPLRAKTPRLGLRHFSTTTEVVQWHRRRPPGNPDVIYLIDYELLGESSNGLALIEQLQIAPQAILVTSRYEEGAIRAHCAALGVRLIPKGLAGFVPIAVQPRENRPLSPCADLVPAPARMLDCVLIDDDPMNHMVWNLSATRHRKMLQTFTAPDAFLAIAAQLQKQTPIYIDSQLGETLKGEDVAKTIHALGFENIYLATGYRATDFAPMPWIKGISGKRPPWEV